LDNIDKLRDIKTIVEVSDDSFYIFLVVLVLCLVVVGSLIWIVYKWYQKNKKPKYQFELENTKQTAYKLIEIIRDKEGSEEYINKLHNYTYKKEVPPFDKQLFNEIVEKYKISYSNLDL